MKNIVLGVLIFFCVVHALPASQKAAKQRRLRREQPTCKSNILFSYDAPLRALLALLERGILGA